MTKADLIALAERVERAEGPSFTLELEIFRAINPQATRHSIPNNYTASFDAAITLVPDPKSFVISHCGNTAAHVQLVGGDPRADDPEFSGHAATPALALTAASLRAIAEDMD